MGSFKGTHPEILCKSTVLKNSAKFCKNWKYLRQSLFSKFETGNEVPQSQMFSCVYILQNLLEHLRYCFIDDLWNDFMILQVQKWYSFMSCFINKNYYANFVITSTCGCAGKHFLIEFYLYNILLFRSISSCWVCPNNKIR